MNRYRRLTLLGFGVFSWALILFAWLYLEKTLYLVPCPLCIMQRIAFFLVGLFFILEALCWNRQSFINIIIRIGKYLSIFFGIGLAARQLYIQGLPAEQVPACGFDFWGTLNVDGILGGLWASIQGTGDCAQVHAFLGLGIAKWSIAAFFVFLVVAIVFGREKQK